MKSEFRTLMNIQGADNEAKMSIGTKALFKRYAPRDNYSCLFKQTRIVDSQLTSMTDQVEVMAGPDWAGTLFQGDKDMKSEYLNLTRVRVASPSSPKAILEKLCTASSLELLDKTAIIGNGSYGTVYRCLDGRDGQWKALKVSQNKTRRPRNTEAQLMKLLQDNGLNVPKIYESWMQDRKHYMLMELCEQDLSAFLKKNGLAGRMSEPDIIHFASSLLQVVHHMHLEGYVHMDIKPGKL